MGQIGRLLASSALLLTATATPPASADRAEWTGFVCGFVSSNDPTGIISQNPNAQFGVMNTGIMLAIDLLADGGPTGPSPHFPLESLTSITQHCWIQVNKSDYIGGPPVPSAYCEFDSVVNGVPGPVLMLPQACPIAYSDADTDSVYQCTEWVFQHDSMSETYHWDDPSATAIHEADPAYSTAQCSLAISEDGTRRRTSEPGTAVS